MGHETGYEPTPPYLRVEDWVDSSGVHFDPLDASSPKVP